VATSGERRSSSVKTCLLGQMKPDTLRPSVAMCDGRDICRPDARGTFVKGAGGGPRHEPGWQYPTMSSTALK